MEIGLKIKQLRLKNSLTQEELADRCELTKGYISQLENDLTSPSIATLKDILTALGVGLAEFFDDDDSEPITYGENDYIVKDADECVTKWLVPTAQKNMCEPIIMTVRGGGATAKDLPHDGEEFGYILEGAVKLTVGSRVERLEKGMSFYFRSDKTHFIENTSKTDEAVLLWITTPPNF